MLQQDQWHLLQRHSACNASRGALPAGRSGDGASGPGFVAVPRPWQPRALWWPGSGRRVPARRAQRVLDLTAFLLSGGRQWKLYSRQHWWDTFYTKRQQYFRLFLSFLSFCLLTTDAQNCNSTPPVLFYNFRPVLLIKTSINSIIMK